MAYVYRHIRLDKNQPFYIGIGSDAFFHRANQTDGRSLLWNSIANKGGLLVEIIMDDISWYEACVKEIEFIALYGRINTKTGTLANLTDGGEGAVGRVITDEQRLRMVEAGNNRVYTKEYKDWFKNLRKGVKQSEIQIRKRVQSFIAAGYKPTQETRDKASKLMSDINMNTGKPARMNTAFKGYVEAYRDGQLIGTYEGVVNCGKELGVQGGKISGVLLGNARHAKGYTFKRLPIL